MRLGGFLSLITSPVEDTRHNAKHNSSRRTYDSIKAHLAMQDLKSLRDLVGVDLYGTIMPASQGLSSDDVT